MDFFTLQYTPADVVRRTLDELREDSAKEHKEIQEVKTQVSRTKIDGVNKKTESSLQFFLSSCCQKARDQQKYVIDVGERVFKQAQAAKKSFEMLQCGTHQLIRRTDRDVSELKTCLDDVMERISGLRSLKEKRDRKGIQLSERINTNEQATASQLVRAEDMINCLRSYTDTQISDRLSLYNERNVEYDHLEGPRVLLEDKNVVISSSGSSKRSSSAKIEVDIEKRSSEIRGLENRLQLYNEERENNDSDQARLEHEIFELNEKFASCKFIIVKEEEEYETDFGEGEHLVIELREAREQIDSLLWDKRMEERSMAVNKMKCDFEEFLKSLEEELQSVNAQVSFATLRAEIMDEMFGEDRDRSIIEWQNIIKSSRSNNSNCQLSVNDKASLLRDIEICKEELDRMRNIAETSTSEYNMSVSRYRNAKRRADEGAESRLANVQLAKRRQSDARSEIESIRNQQLNMQKNTLQTPNNVRPEIKKPEVSGGISDDSDGEVVSSLRVELPSGIVKRQQQADAQIRQTPVPISSQSNPASLTPFGKIINNGSLQGGTSTESTNITDDVLGVDDGDVTMEGIPPDASIDQSLHFERVASWNRETPVEKQSTPSGSSGEMVNGRFAKNIFIDDSIPSSANGFNNDNDDAHRYMDESEMTMEMDAGDFDMSLVVEPAASSSTKVLSPPQPVRQILAPVPSLFGNDSDSDVNQSVWGDDDAF